MARHPYMNRGSYEWVPDYYATTSEGSFGVTRSYDPAVIDYGRPQNALPSSQPAYAHSTEVWGKSLRDASNGQLIEDPSQTLDGSTPQFAPPFLRFLMRESASSLHGLPDPSASEGVGISSFDVWAGNNPFFLFTVDDIGNQRQASITIEYSILTSTEWQDRIGQVLPNTTPLAIVALFNTNDVGGWYNLSRPTGSGGQWGPVSEQDVAVGPAVEAAKSILGGSLTAVHIPPYIYDETGAKTSMDELAVTVPRAYEETPMSAEEQTWGITNHRVAQMHMCHRYFTNSDNFPRLRAILMMPNDRGGSGSVLDRDGSQTHWNATINGIRVYDALQTNVTPEHIETNSEGVPEVVKGQFPCSIFGYAWRVHHPVQMSRYTSTVQPAIGAALSNNPGNARRRGTFRFKLYHPDVPGLGVAHSVRFYYGLAVLAIPGTAPGFNSSLVGVLTSITADMDLLLVQYIGPMPGRQALTFIPGSSQNDASQVGQVTYGGQFGYSRETVALKCFAKDGGNSPPTVPDYLGSGVEHGWRDLGISDLPNSESNGIEALWYDERGSSSTWYTFLSMNAAAVRTFNPDVQASYAGGFSTVVQGAEQTNIPGVGAFNMPQSLASGFSGTEKMTVYAKPKNVLSSVGINPQSYCTASNMGSHLGTFITAPVPLGSSSLHIYAGNWRLRFAAAVKSADRDDVQIFYRFAFVDPELEDDQINGSELWNNPDSFREFYFKSTHEGIVIASGTPDTESLISTPPLGGQLTNYDLTWFCTNATQGDDHFQRDSGDVLERTITTEEFPPWESPRIAVQAWAVAYARPSASTRDPRTSKSYPTVEFAWAGEVDSIFQTMITQSKSGAILAQQDPIVEQYATETKKVITTQDLGPYSGVQSVNSPFRDKPLFAAQVTLGQSFVPGTDNSESLPSVGLLTNEGNAGLSIVDVEPRASYDPLDDVAQMADTFLEIDSGTDAVIGGTLIQPQDIQLSGTAETNNATFDARVIFELYMVNTESNAAYLIGSSNALYLKAKDTDPTATTTASLFDVTISIAQSITVPEIRSKLMLRCKVWAYDNDNTDRAIPIPGGATGVNVDGSEPNINFKSIDIRNFQMNCEEGFEVMSNESYLLGSNNWYQNLPVTTSRTFGASDYYFVADESSVKQSIMPPSTMSGYGYWYLQGWLFSPFWYIDMPDGGVFEIQDRAGLTSGSATAGSGIFGTERGQRSVWTRTAVDTMASSGVSADRGSNRYGPSGFIARATDQDEAQDIGGAPLGVTRLQDPSLLTGLVERIVRAGDTIITGKNPLVVAVDPDNEWLDAMRLAAGRANPEMRLLFYEDDEFDEASHQASITMLANYDGSCTTWRNPYGETGSGGDNKVVLTNDMKMMGAAVDPTSFAVYLVGYRSTNPDSPENGGQIVMRPIRPLMIRGAASAAVAPLHFVDGFLGEDDWNTSSINQPLMPYGPSYESVISQRPNSLGNGGALPATEGFPDIYVDGTGSIYVFYALMPDADDKQGVMGKIFCRRSQNGGYYFEAPFPVADLGYAQAAVGLGIGGIENDDSFEAKHVTCIYDSIHKLHLLFFWSGGKVFMRIMSNPDAAADRAISKSSGGITVPNQLWMVAGNTDFVDGNLASGLDHWLDYQWNLGIEARLSSDLEDGWEDYYGEQRNNFGVKNRDDYPCILISRFADDPDLPPQRVGAFVTTPRNSEEGEVVIVFTDATGRLMFKRIRFSGKHPLISPALHLETNQL